MVEKITEIIAVDALGHQADWLILKHAQSFHGADKEVCRRLSHHDVAVDPSKLGTGSYIAVSSKGAVSASRVLFVGTDELNKLDYNGIREWARRAIEVVESQPKGNISVVTTIHGPGFGLDEEAAFKSQLQGFDEALRSRSGRNCVQKIIVAEPDQERAERLADYLRTFQPDDSSASSGINANSQSVFVAMPFSSEFNDVFKYGIQAPLKEAGFKCERVDNEQFFGDIVDQIKRRIRDAAFLVVDLTGANPNVMLEVGYAWGLNKKTLLFTKEIDKLPFDVKGQRCLKYEKISDFEDKLREELKTITARPNL